ncbi:MAG: hypothetical protein HQL67_01510 [Magnetococcales bacterium]|nr:hypothetical protein [Magnetococcales bacterium]
MIPADVVSQVMTITQVTQVTNISIDRSTSKECSGCGRNDFAGMLDDIFEKKSDNPSSISSFFPGVEDGLFSMNGSSDLFGLFSQMIGQERRATGTAQSPFDFIQSMSMGRQATFQSASFFSQSEAASGFGIEDPSALMHRLAHALGRQSREFDRLTTDNLWTFPPADAPQEVTNAWNAATTGATEADKMLISGLFMELIMQEQKDVNDSDSSDDLLSGIGVDTETQQALEMEQYWEQVEALMAMIDRSVENSPERQADSAGARGILELFLVGLKEESA